LTSPDCDLRGYDFMPLFGKRLFESWFEEKASDLEFRVGIRLWWEAWTQCPAASLPDDDAKLTRLAGLGRDMKTWTRIKAVVLHGFVRCNDGRLYHKLLAALAIEAYQRRLKDRARQRNHRAASKGDGDHPSGAHVTRTNGPVTRDNPPVSRGQTPHVTRTNGPVTRTLTENPRDLARRVETEESYILLEEGVPNPAREGKTDPIPPVADAVGETAAGGIVVNLVTNLRSTATRAAAARPERTTEQQVKAVATQPPTKRPIKAIYAPDEHLRAAREQLARRAERMGRDVA
jgi:hypothetical protein